MIALYSVLVVEDDPGTLGGLRELLDRYMLERGLDLEVRASGAALDMLDSSAGYDICLLDIDLPGVNGMEAAQILRDEGRAGEIIFVTNLAQYAVRGYEVDASGFIVKPTTYTSLAANLDRAVRSLERSGNRILRVGTAFGLQLVRLCDLVFVEVRNHNLTYHLADGRAIEGRGSLSALEHELGTSCLLKVSRYCLANMDHVVSIGARGVELSSGDVLRISHGHKKEIEAALASYLGGRR